MNKRTMAFVVFGLIGAAVGFLSGLALFALLNQGSYLQYLAQRDFSVQSVLDHARLRSGLIVAIIGASIGVAYPWAAAHLRGGQK